MQSFTFFVYDPFVHCLWPITNFRPFTGFSSVGGYDGLVRKYPNASTKAVYRVPNTTCHETDPNAFKMLREIDDDYMPWLGFLLGQTPGSIWYWCADQVRFILGHYV